MPKRRTSYSSPRPTMRTGKGGYQLPQGRARARRRPGATYLNHSQGFGRRRSGFRASGPNTRKPYAYLAIGCAFLFFLATVIWYLNRSVDITYNGEPASARINSTIAQFIEDNGLAEEYDSGNLLAVDDSVLERGAGARYTVTLNGEEVPADAYETTKLTGGEELTVDDGADVYEEHDVQATDIMPTVTIDGTGAIQYVKAWGRPGRSEIWTGKVSGITADRGIVQEVVNCEIAQASVFTEDSEKLVALTFDEGPSSYTEQILSILTEKGVKATFFLQGDAAEANPAAARAIADAGCEIGSNTYSDTDLTGLSADEVRSQIERGADAIEAASGVRPTVLRAPYASFSLENWTQAMDLVSAVVSWNVDSGDWLVPGADEVTDTVVGSVRAGSIVLLTDGDATGEQTLEALPQIIDRLQEEGYTLVTLSELIKSDVDLREEVDLTKVGMPEGASLPVIPEEEE